MPDAGDVKARVIIEYDGSGIDKAKKDLESLADIVGGGLAESTGSANEALSSLDEQMSKSADSTTALVSSVSSLEKPMQRSADVVTTVTEALGTQQSVIEDTGTAFERLQKPIQGTTVLMESASTPMLSLAKSAESMQTQISEVNTGFAQIGESLSTAVPLLPQFASSLHSVSEEFDPRAFGLDTFNENMAVFQDALQNPYPFQLINQHLTETGQTWDDFSSSIGDNNAALLDQMAAMPVVSEKAFSSMSSGVTGMGQSFYEAAGQTEAFNKQWADLADGVSGVNKFGGVGAIPYGPAGELGQGVGEITSIGDMFSGAMGFLSDVAMPLMAVQMIVQVVGQVSSGIYNMAALAEGPAAHSVGTFTGAVDRLGQSAKSVGEQFSEGFGQSVLPMLDAMNNVSGQSSSGGFWSSIGSGIGGVLNLLGNVGEVIVGAGLAGTPAYSVGLDMLKSGGEGLLNTGANFLGLPEPYPTPGGNTSTSVQIDLPAIQQSITQSIAVMNAQASNPGYLAAQAYLQSQARDASLGQAYYDASHTTGMTPFDYTPQAYQNAMINAALHGGPTEGIDPVALNRAYFNSFPYEDANQPSCFPAGTPILLANGTEKAIDALQIGEHVLAHDGANQVATTIVALIKPPPKHVYEIAFADGSTLTLTDAHPIKTIEGWKSLSPQATKRENPDLLVSELQVGDEAIAVDGTRKLIGIQPRGVVQIYNITVDNPHTFYASGILVHNKALGAQLMQNVADTQVPQVDMKNSNLITSMMSNFSGADLSHTFTASVSWVGENLQNTFTGAASWVGQNLSNAFTGVASWIGQGLSNAFTGVASWVGQGLSNTFSGVASWIGQGLSNIFTGVAQWVGQGLQNTFSGVAQWVGQNLEHTFTAVANWVGQGLSQTFSLATSSVPGFASGVEGFQGGLAVVGEHGPELVHLPQGSSVYPQSATGGFPSLGLGDGGHVIVTINHTTMLDSKVVAQETIPYIAPILRATRGIRQ